jgi:hypothetical protein
MRTAPSRACAPARVLVSKLDRLAMTDNSGVQQNNDGSTTYFISVINPGNSDVEFHFRGAAL